MTNIQRLQDSMTSVQCPAYLLTDMTNIGWLTGFSGSFAQVIALPDRAIFITDSRYAEKAAEVVKGFDVRTFGSPVTGLQFLKENLEKEGITNIWIEAESVSVGTLARWTDKNPDVSFEVKSDLTSPLRMVKSTEELAAIRKACKLADAAMAHVMPLLAEGVSELQIDLELQFYFKKQGADVAFAPIVVSGPNSALPHGKATDRLLAEGDFVTLDFGALVDGYCSDMTRSFVIGKATDRHVEIYNQVLKAQLAAIEMMKPGVAAKDVDARSREVLEEKGLAKYFGHGLGHGLGRAVHDPGSLNASSPHTLAVGQVWTVEPGVYIPGFGGVRIEDDVVVTETGVEILNASPKELMVL